MAVCNTNSTRSFVDQRFAHQRSNLDMRHINDRCGAYRFPDYDRTVSVIDLKTFQVIKTIDVAINLHRMKLDRYGRIYVSSRGD